MTEYGANYQLADLRDLGTLWYGGLSLNGLNESFWGNNAGVVTGTPQVSAMASMSADVAGTRLFDRVTAMGPPAPRCSSAPPSQSSRRL